MSVPAKKTPKRRTRQRRSHDALKKAKLSVCTHCGAQTAAHRACTACGYYAGKPLRAAEEAPTRQKKATPKK